MITGLSLGGLMKFLNVNCLGYIWYNQTAELNVYYVKNKVKISLVYQFEQNWNATIHNNYIVVLSLLCLI